MKSFLFGLLLAALALPVFSFGKGPVDSLFVRGNALYAKGKYQEAASDYQRILDSGYVSSELYFNLGNAYYKLAEIPLALLNFERAYKLAPGDEDVGINIQFANQKIRDKIEAAPEFFLENWWHAFILFWSAETLAVLAVTGVLVGFGALILYLFASSLRLKKSAFYSGLVVIVLALVFVAVAGLQVRYLEHNSSAIVFAGTVHVKSGPKDNFATLFVIHEGLKVGILEKSEGWIKISLPNGNVGWIESSAVREI